MSEDPKLFDAGDYNLFRYCHNDPEDLTDPMGLDVILELGGVYFGNSVMASEFAGGVERGHMPSAYNPRIQVNPDRSEAALPARYSKAVRDAGIEVANLKTDPSRTGRDRPAQTNAKITDVGPHNVRDRYSEKNQRPLAEKQFAQHEKGQTGKPVTNPAGVDLTPKAMDEINAQGSENTRQIPVIWWFKDEPFSGYRSFEIKIQKGAEEAGEADSQVEHTAPQHLGQ